MKDKILLIIGSFVYCLAWLVGVFGMVGVFFAIVYFLLIATL